MSRRLPPTAASLAILLALMAAVYSNHFRNSFHFDDSHTVTENPHIRSLGNVGRFFSDASTFSVLRTHQVYRPVVSTSLALDYWLGGGLDPLMFHISTFFWYSVLIAVLWLLYPGLLGGRRALAWFGAAVFALHPVSAETVNYIIQRADLYCTLGVASAVLAYARWPKWRRYGVYLIPFILAALSKPPALVLPALLFVYTWLYEEGGAKPALRAALPALGAAAAMGVLLWRMTPPSFSAGGGPAAAYWLTQTWVTLRYFAAFFWPGELSADSDLGLLRGFPPEAAAGSAFLLGVLAIIVWTARSAESRAIAFGLAWFLIALAPTALTPLAEAANDHRMFFPFVGLTLAVCGAAKMALARAGQIGKRVAAAVGCLLLAVAGAAAHQRNEVWRSEETLWRDVTMKSPRNGRGWMNYGLTQMAKAEYAEALASFDKARSLSPNYPLAEINTAIALAGLGRDAEAEDHFHRGLALAPSQAASHYYYARWLLQKRRYAEAIDRLKIALAINPADLDAHHLLMRAYFEQQDWSQLRPLAEKALALDANDAPAKDYLSKLAELEAGIARVRQAAEAAPSPESYLELSLAYYRSGRFSECLDAARKAAGLRPGYADAWNNIAACHNALGQWDDGIAAASKAVRLNPASELSRNNLAWAISQKGLAKR